MIVSPSNNYKIKFKKSLMKYKNGFKLLFAATLLNIALFSGAFSQRNHDNSGGERHSEKRDNSNFSRGNSGNSGGFQRGSDNSQQRSFQRNDNFQRNNNQTFQRNENSQRNNDRTFQNTDRNNVNRSFQRNNDRNFQSNQTRTFQRDNNNRSNDNNSAYRQSQNSFRRNDLSRSQQSSRNYFQGRFNNNRSYRSYPVNYYRSRSYGYPSAYSFSHRFISWRPYYRTIPRTYLSINFGGHPYYYGDGYFYDYYDGYYRPFFPQPGLRISFLPYGYYPVYIGSDMFYYSNGSYYRKFDDTNYEVVDAPVGAQIPTLPADTKSVMVNGEKFYELNGTYYKEGTDANGKVVYTVVGKNGEINNSDESADDAPLQVGDLVDQLPPDCKTVNVNGEELIVTPDKVYFKEEKQDNTTVYRVVSVPNN